VKIVTVPDWTGDECSSDGISPTGQLLVAGAIEPDWGPADVPARTDQDPPPPPADKLTLTVGKAKLRQALRRGLKVKVGVPAAGKLTGSARRGAKTVAGGQGRAKAAGTATLTLRFSKKAKRALAHSRRPKLTVKVAFTASGTKKATYATTTIGLR
jgi:hypothetical protein